MAEVEEEKEKVNSAAANNLGYSVTTHRFTDRGIKKITLPISFAEFYADGFNARELIEAKLSEIISRHDVNANKIKYLYNFAFGDQDIKDKTRPFAGDRKNNNTIVENHAFSQVNFKVGFLLGDKRKFTKKNENLNKDIERLETYLSDSDFYSEDKDLKTWIYATGIGTTLTQPNSEIINVDGSLKPDVDLTKQAPFVNRTVDPTSNFVVYSSTDNSPLFCVSVGKKLVRKDYTGSIRYDEETTYNVWTLNTYFEFDRNMKYVGEKGAINYGQLPIIEHSTNTKRIGIVEINRDNFNTINMLVSTGLDGFVDSANRVIVFQNVTLGDRTVSDMKQAGAIEVSSDSESGGEGKVYTIDVAFNFDNIDAFYQQRIVKCYDIVGVPLASGTTTSGGDTAQARLLGGGWNNAYSIIKSDILSLRKSDYAQLGLILSICKMFPGTGLDNLFPTDVEIKYSINPNDNVLAKAQAASNLYNIGMPPEMVLATTNLSLDPQSDGKKWQMYIDDRAKKEAEKAEHEQAVQTTNNLVNSPKNGENGAKNEQIDGNTTPVEE